MATLHPYSKMSSAAAGTINMLMHVNAHSIQRPNCVSFVLRSARAVLEVDSCIVGIPFRPNLTRCLSERRRKTEVVRCAVSLSHCCVYLAIHTGCAERWLSHDGKDATSTEPRIRFEQRRFPSTPRVMLPGTIPFVRGLLLTLVKTQTEASWELFPNRVQRLLHRPMTLNGSICGIGRFMQRSVEEIS